VTVAAKACRWAHGDRLKSAERRPDRLSAVQRKCLESCSSLSIAPARPEWPGLCEGALRTAKDRGCNWEGKSMTEATADAGSISGNKITAHTDTGVSKRGNRFSAAPSAIWSNGTTGTHIRLSHCILPRRSFLPATPPPNCSTPQPGMDRPSWPFLLPVNKT